MKKQNAGFTLIELVVAIAMATIVTAAATSVLLMGLRINRQTGDTASQQITVRSLLNIVEKAAADGNIKGVVTKDASWELVNTPVSGDMKAYRVIFGFDSENHKIYTGKEYDENGDVSSEGTTVLEGVYASNVTIEDKLLSVSVETREGLFATSIYCRTTELKDESTADNDLGTNDGTTRSKFIEILKKEYRSRGEIKGVESEYTYYSEWYIQGYKDGWNADTPWCACYVSWALVEAGISGPMGDPATTDDDHPRWFANVDYFMDYFIDNEMWMNSAEVKSEQAEELIGNLIFFDWDKGTDPEHVGVVTAVKTVKIGDQEKTVIYTIEGNSSGRVAIRSYTLGDPRIIGYGILFAS